MKRIFVKFLTLAFLLSIAFEAPAQFLSLIHI